MSTNSNTAQFNHPTFTWQVPSQIKTSTTSSENSKMLNLVDDYLQQLDWQVKENANMSYSLQGLRHYIDSEVIKLYWLEKIYPEYIALAHIEGDFHIHDLGDKLLLLRVGSTGTAESWIYRGT